MNLLNRWRFRRIDLAGAALVAAAAGLFYWMGILPVLSLQERAHAHQAQLQDQRRNAAYVAARAEEIKKTLTMTRRAFDAIAVHLEPAASINNRISHLTSLAAKNNLKIDEVQPAEPVYGKDYGSVPIVLNGSGSFANWAAFLHELSRLFPDTSVDSFQLSNKSAGPVNPAQFHISLIWYVSPQPLALAAQ